MLAKNVKKSRFFYKKGGKISNVNAKHVKIIPVFL
jgi:hypothetical protein